MELEGLDDPPCLVAGAVIGDDDFVRRARLDQEAEQAFSQRFRVVVRGDDDTGFHGTAQLSVATVRFLQRGARCDSDEREQEGQRIQTQRIGEILCCIHSLRFLFVALLPDFSGGLGAFLYANPDPAPYV